jgi:hypothetical protein
MQHECTLHSLLAGMGAPSSRVKGNMQVKVDMAPMSILDVMLDLESLSAKCR